MVRITYYLDVISSWCHYVEPVWKDLKEIFGDDLETDWQIALIPEEGLPGSVAEEEWYYRRSGILTRQSVPLNSGWIDLSLKEYLIPNLVAVVCRDLGYEGDDVRLAITEAALYRGEKVGTLEVSASVAAGVSGLSEEAIIRQARNGEAEKKIRQSTSRFHSYGINQRPAFFLESEIEDRAIFSGLIKPEPLITTIHAMMEDVKAYRAWSAHMGQFKA